MIRHRLVPPSLVALLIAGLVSTSPAFAQPPADLQLDLVTGGLSSPVAVRHAGDGSDRLFVVEQGGVIRIIDDGVLLPTPFLDIDDIVLSGGELGLLGLAFHPDYASNGFFYVNYNETEPNPPPCPGFATCTRNTVVARYSVSGNPDIADDSSEQRVIVINQDFSNHNGGDIHFGPDGYLYVGMGDGGDGGDPNNRAQTLDNLLGKMLRLDVDGDDFPGDPDRNYAIPPDNPFVGIAGEDEIWALGLRNPFRFSFDRTSGDMFLGDVGQGAREEISFEALSSAGGLNFGWSCREGFVTQNFNPCLPGPLTDPIIDFSHPGNGVCAVTGGYRYRGHQVFGLHGFYSFADFCSGEVWFAEETAPGVWNDTLWADVFLSPSAFGEDEDGELYLVNHGGSVHRFVSPSTVFFDGFESGDTSAW